MMTNHRPTRIARVAGIDGKSPRGRSMREFAPARGVTWARHRRVEFLGGGPVGTTRRGGRVVAVGA